MKTWRGLKQDFNINGFIGSNLASYLSSINHNIYGSVSEDWKLYNKHKLVKKLFVIKLNKPFDETIFNEMDVIIHCAYDDSKHSTATNINGTISISKAANSNKTKQIFICLKNVKLTIFCYTSGIRMK